MIEDLPQISKERIDIKYGGVDMEEWTNKWIIENFEDIVNDEFMSKISGYIYKRVGNEEDVLELLKDCVADIIDNLKREKFRGSSKKEFWKYIFTITDNKIKDYYDDKNLDLDEYNEVGYVEGISECFAPLYSLKEPVDKQVIDKIGMEHYIREFKGILTEDQFEVLIYIIGGLKSPDIAKEVDKSSGAVRKLLERARRNLEKFFDGEKDLKNWFE